MDKEKKKTLTISTNLKKKIDTSSISTTGKKSYSIEKKNFLKSTKTLNRNKVMFNIFSETSVFPTF